MYTPSAVSFSATTHWLMMAGSMIFTACGISTRFITWVLRRPMAYAASAWPRGTALTPARSTSARTEPLYRVSAMTTPQKDELLFSMPRPYQMNTISSSTGIARKNSTKAQAGQRTHLWSDSLPTPRKKPSTTAPRMAMKAIFTVSSSPWKITLT